MTKRRFLPTKSEGGDEEKPKRFGLSWTQIVAAGFASITATVILSFFSISGTLIGAAVFSMASAVGNAVYGQSLRSTKDKVAGVVKADPASPTVVLPVVEDEPAAEDEPDSEPVLPSRPAGSGVLPTAVWKRVAFSAAAIFVFVIAVVTSVELVAGRPLTDVLRGEKGSGTSLFGGTTRGGAGETPTVVVTVTPSVSYTTPTMTVTAPNATTTVPPTGTDTTTQAPESSGSPTDSGSASTSPSSDTTPSGSSTRARP